MSCGRPLGERLAAALFALNLVALGCGERSALKDEGAGVAAVDDEGADLAAPDAGVAVAATPPGPLPDTAEAFLDRLAPLPEGPLRVRYALRGPAGSEGELELMMASGMRRAENWHLRMPRPGAESFEVRGRSRMSPARAWSSQGPDREGPGSAYALPYADIAAAYMAAPVEQRRAWVDEIDAWHAALAEARQASPGEREEIAGVSCLRMRMAGQDLCLWEEVALPLEHKSSAFELRAVEVVRGSAAELGAKDFAMPPTSNDAVALEVPESMAIAPADFFELLERGDAKALTLVLTVGLRLPDPITAPSTP